MISDDLAREVKVITTHDVLKAASINNPEKYMPNEDVEVDNVTKVLKVVVSIGLNEVPVVGGMLSGLIGLFWPGGDDSIWEGTKDNVERLVDEKIGEQTAKDNRLRLKGICKVLQIFAQEPPKIQARNFHGVVNILMENEPLIFENESPWYNLPYLAPFGTLYLSALYTQWKHCEKIDKSSDSKPAYKKLLEEEVYRLQALVQDAKKNCIERRKKDIKLEQLNAYDQITMEDPHSHTEITVTGALEDIFKNGRMQLDFEVESKYSAEIDKILEPTHLWGRFIPGHEQDIQTYHHLEYPGGEWKGITSETKFTNPQAVPGGLGRLCKIEWFIAPDYYNTNEVVGLSLVFENTEIMLGSRRGGYVCAIELGREVVIGVKTKVSTDYRDRDRIEYIEFTYAPATIDAQGNLSLLAKDRVEEATKSLRRIRKDKSEKDMEFKHAHSNDHKSKWSELIDAKIRRRTMVALLAIFVQQITGQTFASQYSVIFYLSQGFGARSFVFSVLSSVAGLACLFITWSTVDLVGRRVLLLVGGTGMAVFLFIVGAVGTIKNPTETQQNALVASSAYALSWAPVSYIVLSEAASSHIKEKTNLVASVISVLTTFATSFTLPYLLSKPYAALGAKVGFIYGSFCVAMVVLAYFFIPELKGRSLEEVDQLFTSGESLRKLGFLKTRTAEKAYESHAKQ
ncbi:hexose transporter 2 [Fusarium subglutinans]|uniref:Hexose transporter 2 n=1 Tax=Gibberella subglutinans TaxID=42677 RepID=A0A8H5PWB3_GIBSU|nr:hexose transporter 2 [Fusarium subglutinans]KAF5603824.1 hexose transporter 2 [Fusarium subglutinans]